MSEAATTEAPGDTATVPGQQPAIAPFAELSRLMLVGIDANQGHHILWTAQAVPNGPWNKVYAPVNADTSYLVLGTGSTTDGRVAMAALTRAEPAAVHYIDEAPQAPGGEERWNAPVDLGLPSGVAGFVQLAMQRDADGRVEIFGVDGAAGGVWWIYQNPSRLVERTEEVVPPGSTTPITVQGMVTEPPQTPWSDWIRLPGEGIARLTVANDVTGRIALVATGNDPQATAVYVNAQMRDPALAAADWTGWTRIDTAASGTAGAVPTAVLDPAGCLNIFMVGARAQVVQTRQTEPGASTWSDWHQVSLIGAAVVNVVSAFDGAGNIVLMALDENLGLHANCQSDARRQVWSGWQQVGVAPGFGLAAMDYNADGALSYFQGESATDGVQFVSQVAPNSSHWSAAWTTLADTGIFTYGIVRDLTPLDKG
ncbi:hypothetical protein [Hoeflea olei]|nr:hypothetical protein [Hoeflea olei]